MPEPSAELEEWAVGDYPEVINPITLLPEPWSEQPRRDDASRPAIAADGFVPDEPTGAEGVNSWLELARLWIENARDEVARDRFGDGSDGDETIAGTTTLTAPAYYDDLVVTGTLVTRGHPVYVRGRLSGNGTIDARGADASGATGGAVAGGTSSWGRGSAGGNAGAPGSDGGARTNSLGGAGGAGGNEGGGGSAGGAAGAVTVPTDALGGTDVWRALDAAVTGRTPDGTVVTGGSGGGGGGGGTGGGGGAGGDVLGLFVHEWGFTGTITARGGAGAAATASDDGGGGSGGGGTIDVIHRRGDSELDVVSAGLYNLTVTVAGTDYVATVDVRAGTAGAGNGTGFAGAVGSVGAVYVRRG